MVVHSLRVFCLQQLIKMNPMNLMHMYFETNCWSQLYFKVNNILIFWRFSFTAGIVWFVLRRCPYPTFFAHSLMVLRCAIWPTLKSYYIWVWVNRVYFFVEVMKCQWSDFLFYVLNICILSKHVVTYYYEISSCGIPMCFRSIAYSFLHSCRQMLVSGLLYTHRY